MPEQTFDLNNPQELRDYINQEIKANSNRLIKGGPHNAIENGLLDFIESAPLNAGSIEIITTGGVVNLSKAYTYFTGVVPSQVNFNANKQKEWLIINDLPSPITLGPTSHYFESGIEKAAVPAKSTLRLGLATNGSWLKINSTDADPNKVSGFSGFSGMSTSGFSGKSGFSGFGFSGWSGKSGYSGFGFSGASGYSGFGFSGASGYSGAGTSGYSGYSGNSTSGFSGFSGASAASGISGYSGRSGFSGAGTSGFSGFSGISVSGFSGYSGAGFSGFSGYSGNSTSGFSGLSGFSGNSTSGYSGYSGATGPGGGDSGFSGFSGNSTSGFSGISGFSGKSGYSGVGISGFSGFSGAGFSGFSGFSGASTSGFSGQSGFSGVGVSGFSGKSGYSGYSGVGNSGFSGYSGLSVSGFSGFSGSSTSGFSGFSGRSGFSGLSGFSGNSTSGFSGYSGLTQLLFMGPEFIGTGADAGNRVYIDLTQISNGYLPASRYGAGTISVAAINATGGGTGKVLTFDGTWVPNGGNNVQMTADGVGFTVVPPVASGYSDKVITMGTNPTFHFINELKSGQRFDISALGSEIWFRADNIYTEGNAVTVQYLSANATSVASQASSFAHSMRTSLWNTGTNSNYLSFAGMRTIASTTAAGINKIVFKGNATDGLLSTGNTLMSIPCAGIPIYSDNANATGNGLVSGDLYRTSTGSLQIVY